MKILFVATRKNSNQKDRELYEMEFMIQLLGFKRSLLDLGLMTVAAATPSQFDIEIVDEYFQDIPYDTDADLVALSAKTSCVPHAYEVADQYRKHGKKVVLGGIHASLRPDEALEHVDYVVTGEAEQAWPQFLELFAKGEAPRKFKADGFPPMEQIPIPAWGSVDTGNYLFHQLQVTRGCPFTCRFCSVPDISGPTFRCKPIELVISEIKALPKSPGILGRIKDKMKALYVVDDNFISRAKYTKELLEALVPLYQTKELREWSAETTLNVAREEELLELFKKSGCTTLILGLESVSEKTLLEMRKKINFCLTFPEALDRIHKKGMSVVGNFIVGFDTDTLSVFRDTFKFVQDTHILYPFYSILTPMPGTKLHDDYKSTNRLDHYDWGLYDTRHVVFEPKQMTREQLMDGYIWLYEQSYVSDAALTRLEGYWVKYGNRKSTKIENEFIRWRMRRHMRGTSSRFQNFVKQGWQLIDSKHLKSDISQLIYYFDAAHFFDYLYEFRSPNYSANSALFESYKGEDTATKITGYQWDRKGPEIGANTAASARV